MNIIQKAAATVGRVIETVLGEDFNTPINDAMDKYPGLRYSR